MTDICPTKIWKVYRQHFGLYRAHLIALHLLSSMAAADRHLEHHCPVKADVGESGIGTGASSPPVLCDLFNMTSYVRYATAPSTGRDLKLVGYLVSF